MPTDREEPPGGYAGPSEGDAYADALVQNLVAVYDSCRGGAAEEPWPRESKAVAWARVSTEQQADKGRSIPEQLREIRAYASQRGIQIVQEFHEAASAFQHYEKRAEFHRMLAAVSDDPSIGLVLVHDYSRFSRDSLKARLLIRDLWEAGVRVVSLNDPPLDRETPAGVFLEGIIFAKNEAYSREISFHTRKGCRANIGTRDVETGWCYKNGSAPPVGYRAVRLYRGERRVTRPNIKQIWLLDDTAIAGRQLYEWVHHCLVELAGNGATGGQISEFCEHLGLPSRTGQWTAVGWCYRLRPHCLLQYCGHAVWRPYGGRGGAKSAADWLVIDNAHPAILTPGEAVVIAAARRGCAARVRSHSRGRVYRGQA